MVEKSLVVIDSEQQRSDTFSSLSYRKPPTTQSAVALACLVGQG